MAQEPTNTSADDSQPESVTINIKSSNAKYTLSVPRSMTTLELKNKLSTSEYADVPVGFQRLIYSGRVLKDGDTLESHKVKEGNTIHLVKSAPSNQRQSPAGQSSGGSTTDSTSGSNVPRPTGVPSNIAAGTGNNPLAGLTGARYAGFAQLPGAGMFGPDGGMGPPPSQDQMIEMLSNPAFAQMMNEALQNPAMIDMMIQQNPQLRDMGPAGRQFLQSEQFRRMVTDPQSLRAMGQLQAAMGMGPFGAAGGGGQAAFPAPGVTATTPIENRESGSQESQGNNQSDSTNPTGVDSGARGINPFAALLGITPTMNPSNTDSASSATSQSLNPFAALLGVPPPESNQQPRHGQQGTDPSHNQQTSPFPNLQNNPLLQNPELMNHFVQAMGGGGDAGSGPRLGNLFGGNAGGANPFANLANIFGGGGMGGPAASQDNRRPEERYATQLRQLNEMGFFDFDKNIQALQRSGGDVNGALEWLFSQP